MIQHRCARAAVFSAGSWGTAVAKIMADAGTDAINTTHRNAGYFPDVDLPETLTATTDPAAALENADFLVLSIPAQFLRESLAAWAPHIRRDTVIVSLIKGIERETDLRASEVITQVTGVPAHRGKVDGST